MPSGVPVQVGGKWIGYTDFSEFALQAPGALPAGLTLRGNAFPNAPNSFGIANDVAEGNYLSMNGQDTSRWGISYNAFDNLLTFGEFLARVWIANNTGNRRVVGPALMNADAPAAWDLVGGHIFKRSNVDYESEVGSVLNAVDGSHVTVDMRFAEQAGVWAWVRFQRLDGNPSGGDQGLVKSWYGTLASEQDGWDALIGSFTRAVGLALLGWGCNAVFNDSEQRIAYFAFSEDPTVNVVPPPGGSPPPPGTPSAPTVTVDPLQDRWVGLEGSPYVVP